MVNNHALELFKKASTELPAYKNFLASQSFDPLRVTSASDFKSLPFTTKDNYLRRYPYQELVWKEDMRQPLIFCSTSGSTGEPYYFPRSEQLSQQYSYLIEDYLSRNKPKGKTLVILAFGMGVWIGGVITLRAFEIATQRMNASVSMLPAGYNKPEIFKALKNLAPQFDQTIIVGYPPFVKELLDEAETQQIKLHDLKLRLLFAAEAFTEKFRNYVCAKAGIENPLLDTLNIYGTADIGAMAYETPLSIMIRRIASDKPQLFTDIFGQIEKTPTLAQYNPDFMEFEEVEGEIFLTGNSAMPLIRYAIGDNGGVRSYQNIENVLQQNGIDLNEEAKKQGIDATIQYHPFVFVYERKNLSASLHGILIYPEYIKEALVDENLSPYVTERFTMITKTDENENQFLEINLELQSNVEHSTKIEQLGLEAIQQSLLKKSSEFNEISQTANGKKLLKVVIWPKDYAAYFAPGVKQKWTLAKA